MEPILIVTLVAGAIIGVVVMMLCKHSDVPVELEFRHKCLVERIQNVLGLVSQLDANPNTSQLRDELLRSVREFKSDLEGDGMSVVMEPDENHKGFIQLVNVQSGKDREIARPLILRGDRVVLPGIELVSKKG